MELKISRRDYSLPVEIDILATSIADVQKENGEIPWHEGGKTDPWDHVEAAIGLSIGGYFKEAKRAFEWLAETQLDDGSWYSAYKNGEPEDHTRESNMSSYIAVGLFHYYLITNDREFLARMWPCMSAGIDYAIGLQAPGGEIYWARNPQGEVDPMSLLTGSSSVYMSIKCALAIASHLDKDKPEWEIALDNLGEAICSRPNLFNKEKARFSMDWFYPVLCGAIAGAEATKRIKSSWDTFVVEDMGVRCVSDEPWVTMAETSELALTLVAMGNVELAETILKSIEDKKFNDGSYWCGVTFPDRVIWPEEKITWTNAAVLMAADAIYNITPASRLFNHAFWEREYARQTKSRNIKENLSKETHLVLTMEDSATSHQRT
jgi:hypothetical protein